MILRIDGRRAGQLREIRVTRGWLNHTEGSILTEFGKTRTLVAVSVTVGVFRWRRGTGLGWVTAEYSMLPRAIHSRSDREPVRSWIGGRTHETSRLMGRSLCVVVNYSALGGNTIVLDCDVLQADGDTRIATVTGAYVTLAGTAIHLRELDVFRDKPLKDSVTAVSVGFVEGVPLPDLAYEEDLRIGAGMSIVMTESEDFTEVQDAVERTPFSRANLNQLLDLGAAGCAELTRLQREALV